MSFQTPETKQLLKQLLAKGTPGPIKAKVYTTRKKQMMLAFFNAMGLIYMNFVPKGKTVTAAYIIEPPTRFLRV